MLPQPRRKPTLLPKRPPRTLRTKSLLLPLPRPRRKPKRRLLPPKRLHMNKRKPKQRLPGLLRRRPIRKLCASSTFRKKRTQPPQKINKKLRKPRLRLKLLKRRLLRTRMMLPPLRPPRTLRSLPIRRLLMPRKPRRQPTLPLKRPTRLPTKKRRLMRPVLSPESMLKSIRAGGRGLRSTSSPGGPESQRAEHLFVLIDEIR